MKIFVILIIFLLSFLPVSLVYGQDCWTCEYYGNTEIPPLCEPFECPPLPNTPSDDLFQEQENDDDDSSDDDVLDVVVHPEARYEPSDS
jgi:hypothetical protein